MRLFQNCARFRMVKLNIALSKVIASVLTTENVILGRDNRHFAKLPDIDLAAGQSVAIIGVSGSGKTTALMALAGVRPPMSGTIHIGETDLWKLRGRARDRLRGRKIGLVFQSFHLVDALSVQQNLLLAARCAGLRADWGRVDHLLSCLDLSDVRTRRADRISQGQAQRAAVARALFNRPTVLLADEPTSALDDANAAALLALLKESATVESAGLVLATHDRRVLDAVDTVIEMERIP
jgi:putative ABC transport system ATP-binding protein